MKAQVDDSNYESMIGKLTKGSIEEKSQCLKKLFFLYENARSRIYLYERRITESLELSLLIEEKDISLNALSLLEKIIVNTSSESEIFTIIKKRLLSKIVLNLGSVEIAIRKISHKCVLEYVKKFRDYEAVTAIYLKTAIQQAENLHLKVKAISSFHSLLMSEHKHFSHDQTSSKTLLEELIFASYQKDHQQIRRAALLCLIFLLKIKGVEPILRAVLQQTEAELFQLRCQSQELASLLDLILKIKPEVADAREQEQSEQENNTPSPKFLSIQESEELRVQKTEPVEVAPMELQMKIFNEVSYAEEFLKRLEKTGDWQFQEIQDFAPFLEKCLIDQSIKLFSISKKIVEVIFNSEGGKKREYYVVLVPCIVNGIGNKRFIVRKNIDKLVRQYLRNHTEVWVQNFIERFSVTKNSKVKETLIDLMMHAYKTSPEFYCPTEKAFEAFDLQICDSSSSLKRKLIECIVLILEKQGKDERNREEMLQVFSADPYSKIIRKMGKTNPSLGSYSEDIQNQTIESISPVAHNSKRKHRLVTAEPEKVGSVEKSDEKEKSPHVSQGKDQAKPLIAFKEKRVRNSHIQINFRLKKSERRSKDEKSSQEKLPELKKVKNSSTSKHGANESPVKKSIGEKNILYADREQLRPLDNPKADFEQALIELKDNNWNVQFDAISQIRSAVQFHRELISEDTMGYIVTQLLQCLNNLRSGVAKLALMCLGEMMRRFHKKMSPFTESLVLTIMRKSITTSEFMQEEIKKCIATVTEQLCVSKVIVALNSVRESKSPEIKITMLVFVEIIIRDERNYKKEFEWVWSVLIDFHEEPQFTLRNECKRLVKTILELHKDWKTDVLQLKKHLLDKIDRILKNLNAKGENLWIQVENQEFEKALLSKVMTSKYFAGSYLKFQELDKCYALKKNWKERIKLLNDFFQSAFDHPSEFESNSNAKKYMQIATDHIDEKNPGLLMNSLTNLMKSVDNFPNIVQECIGQIMEKCMMVIETRRAQLVTSAQKMLNKIYAKFDLNKVLKEYLKLCVANPNKVRGEVINQIISLLRDSERDVEGRYIREITLERNTNTVSEGGINASCQNMFVKSLIKLCSDKVSESGLGGKLKELFYVCQKRFGQEFASKVMANDRAGELLV